MRAFIYTRVSTTQQVDNGDSLKEQESTLLKYAESKGYEVVKIYCEEGVSGRKNDREQLQALLDDVKQNKGDIILFTYLSRWFRNQRHYLNTQEILTKHNVVWRAVREEYFNTDTPVGRAMISQMMTFGELEAEMTGERIKSVFEHKIANGEVISGSTSVGFKIANKRLVADERAYIVIELFDYYKKHNNLNRTIVWLADTHNLRLDARSVKGMLRNSLYIGEHKRNPDFCKPIIDKSVFFQVQKLLDNNIKENTTWEYTLNGLLRCGDCGGNYSGKSSKIKRQLKDGSVAMYEYTGYVCGKVKNPLKYCCNRKVIREDFIEKYLLENVKTELDRHVIKSVHKTEVIDNTPKINKINQKIERLKGAYLNEIIDIDEYKSDRQKLIDEINSLQPEAKKQKKLKPILDTSFSKIYKQATKEGKRKIWRSLLSDIIIDSERNIKLIFLA